MNRIAAGLLLFSLLAISSCGSSGPHAVGEKYYLIATNVKIPYWQTAATGLVKAATEMKVQAQMTGPDSYDPKAQVDEFRRVVALKPAGILVSAADPEMLKQPISDAIAAGIPVVTMDSDAPGSQRLVFVGTNNYQAGMIGGRVLARQLKGKGNVAIFTIPAQANLEERLRGYHDALAGFPDIKVVQTTDVRGKPEIAFDQAIQIMESGKVPVHAFVCLEALAGNEVAEVLSRKKITDKVVIAMDTDDRTLEWIEKGVITATIAQRPYTMGYYGLKVLDDLHHNPPKPLNARWEEILASPMPAVIDTGATLVNSSNLAQIRRLSSGPAPGAAQ